MLWKLGRVLMRRDFSNNLLHFLERESEEVKKNVINMLNEGIESYVEFKEVNKFMKQSLIDMEPDPFWLTPCDLMDTAETIIATAKGKKERITGKGAAIAVVKLLGIKATKSLIERIKNLPVL